MSPLKINYHLTINDIIYLKGVHRENNGNKDGV